MSGAPLDVSLPEAAPMTARLEALDYMMEVLRTTLARLKAALLAGPFPQAQKAAILARIAETEDLITRTSGELADIRARREPKLRVPRS